MLNEEKAFAIHRKFFPHAPRLTKRVYEAYQAIYELGLDDGMDMALEEDDDDSWEKDFDGPINGLDSYGSLS